MDAFLRAIAVILELIVIGAIFYHILHGVKIIVLDLGVKSKYSKIITLFLIAIGSILVTFIASHLSVFYPTI